MKHKNYLMMIALALLVSIAANSQSVFVPNKVVYKNEMIRVQYSGFPGNGKDWIAIAKANSGSTDNMDFVYTDGKKSGTIDFRPQTPGLYVVRGYLDNGWTVVTTCQFRIINKKIIHNHNGADAKK